MIFLTCVRGHEYGSRGTRLLIIMKIAQYIISAIYIAQTIA